MPSWIGVGVLIPLPGVVVVVDAPVVVVGPGVTVVPPMTPTQACVLSQRLEQSFPMAGFQDTSWARVTPYFVWMDVQPSPETTRWKRLQLPTIPSWVGVGVWMPLPVLVLVVVVLAVVVVAVVPTGVSPQFCSMQYELPVMMVQVLATDGFCYRY